jgi:hypothetical protein
VEGRARRATVLIAVAVLGMLVAGVADLRPNLAAPTGGASAPSPPTAWEITSASFGDSEHGAIAVTIPQRGGGGPVVTYLTADGGRSWRRSRDYPVSFIDDRRAVGLNGRTLQTSLDGGATWHTSVDLPSTALPAPGQLPVFLDAANGWFLFGDSAVAASEQRTGGDALLRTADGGRTWSAQPARGLVGQVLGQPVFVDRLHGAAVTTPNGTRTALMLTSDGGQSWRLAAPPEAPRATGLALATGILAWDRRLLAWSVLAGAAGIDVTDTGIITIHERPQVLDLSFFTTVSDDGGATWGPLEAGPTVTEPFPPTTVGLQVDDRGRLLLFDDRRLWISEDGGARWTARVVEVPAGVWPLVVVDARSALFAIAARPPGLAERLSGLSATTLLRSRDGGIHWDEIPLPRS